MQWFVFPEIPSFFSSFLYRIRLSASAFAQRLLKQRLQNPSTDTYTYPIVKSVLRFFAKTITKSGSSNTAPKGRMNASTKSKY